LIIDLDDEDVVLKMEANIVAWGLCGVYIIGMIVLYLFGVRNFSAFNVISMGVISLFTCWDRVRTYIMLRRQLVAVEEEIENNDEDDLTGEM
jgi:hypothetical protein